MTEPVLKWYNHGGQLSIITKQILLIILYKLDSKSILYISIAEPHCHLGDVNATAG